MFSESVSCTVVPCSSSEGIFLYSLKICKNCNYNDKFLNNLEETQYVFISENNFFPEIIKDFSKA